MQIAELNIGKIKYELDDPRLAGFMENLDRVNALAERSPGFVWRFTGEGNNATDVIHDGMNVNLSVWERAEDLETYVFSTVHVRFYRRKAEWFDHLEDAYFVMWPVPEGHIPTMEEAFARLEDLRANGPSERAYGWEGLPHLKEWMAKRCA
jgi:hypothetical protein